MSFLHAKFGKISVSRAKQLSYVCRNLRDESGKPCNSQLKNAVITALLGAELERTGVKRCLAHVISQQLSNQPAPRLPRGLRNTRSFPSLSLSLTLTSLQLLYSFNLRRQRRFCWLRGCSCRRLAAWRRRWRRRRRGGDGGDRE